LHEVNERVRVLVSTSPNSQADSGFITSAAGAIRLLQTSLSVVTLHLQRKTMKLLDYLQKTYDVKNDRQLAIKLGFSTPTLSKIRTGKYPVSADMIIAIHETFKMSIKDIKALL
jgi:transcriptional regulator with XRE-family HTH domain